MSIYHLLVYGRAPMPFLSGQVFNAFAKRSASRRQILSNSQSMLKFSHEQPWILFDFLGSSSRQQPSSCSSTLGYPSHQSGLVTSLQQLQQFSRQQWRSIHSRLVRSRGLPRSPNSPEQATLTSRSSNMTTCSPTNSPFATIVSNSAPTSR